MLILPLIDLLILGGTVLLAVGLVLKAVVIATIYQPTLLGFSSLDFVVMAGVCWGLALTLAARAWVKLNEPNLVVLRREQMQAEARRKAREFDVMAAENGQQEPAHAEVRAAGADPG